MTATATLAPLQISFPNLVLNAVGEYTARSVDANPLDATALHLVRQPDGAYAAPAPDPFVVSGAAAGRSSFMVQSALQSLPLGG